MEDGNPWVALLVTILLVGVNGVLASAEIALVGLNETKLKESAKRGDKKSKLLLQMKQNPSNFLSTIQIGITLANLLSGAFAAESLSTPITNWFITMGTTGFWLSVVRAGSFILITFLITYFMLVFGELVPKRIAMVHPEKTARRFIGPINGLAKVTKPLVKLLAASTNGILKLVGISASDQEEAVTEEEILLMVREGHAQGTIEEAEAEIVANLFDYTDSPVSEAMTHRTEMDALSVDSSIQDVVQIMSETFHSRFPVYEGDLDHIVGILYTQDIVALYPKQAENTDTKTVRDIMRPPFFVPETVSQPHLFSQMKRSKSTIAIVVDEFGGTAGLVTLMDIIEEIVGDVEPNEWEDINAREDGSFVVDGRMEMEDVAEYFSLDWNDEMEDTLSGFLIAKLGYVPSRDEKPMISVGPYKFKVSEMDGTRIRRALVRKTES